MLIHFYMGNYESSEGIIIFNLLASNNDTETQEAENPNTDKRFKPQDLKSAIIFGAKTRGRSDFFKNLLFMRHFVLNSSKDSQKENEIDMEPFRLNTDTIKTPIEFEVFFLYENIQYRYGFEIDQHKVVAEWLYQTPEDEEVELFFRSELDLDIIHPEKFKKGDFAVDEGLVKDNTLLLSIAAQLNDENAINVINWFKSLKTISGLKEEGYQGYTMNRTQESETMLRIMEFLKVDHFGIQENKSKLPDIESLPKYLPQEVKERIIRQAKEKNLNNHISDTNSSTKAEESSDAKKMFALTGPIFDILENGSLLVIDELDSKLPPNLVRKLVSLFNSKELNPKNAQLIYNTHDTNI